MKCICCGEERKYLDKEEVCILCRRGFGGENKDIPLDKLNHTLYNYE